MTPPTLTPPTLTPPRALPAPKSVVDQLTVAFVKAFADGDRPAWDAFVRQHRDLPLTVHSVNASLVQCLFAIGERMSELNAELRALKAGTGGHEAALPDVEYLTVDLCGEFRAGQLYKKNAIVKRNGNYFIAKRDTESPEGMPPKVADWIWLSIRARTT